jgi:hypothetical protein
MAIQIFQDAVDGDLRWKHHAVQTSVRIGSQLLILDSELVAILATTPY